MAKYHLKKNLEPGVCNAKPGNCPLGPDAPHYEDKKAAYTASVSQLAKQFGTFGSMEIEDRYESAILDPDTSLADKKSLLKDYYDENSDDVWESMSLTYGTVPEGVEPLDVLSQADDKAFATVLAEYSRDKNDGQQIILADIFPGLAQEAERAEMEYQLTQYQRSQPLPKLTVESIDDAYSDDPAKAFSLKRDILGS